ncbi:MAG: hypothetical protein ACYDD1_16630, partial [Caulobacteraceae bacterium]
MSISIIENPRADAAQEKGLWQIVRKSVGVIGQPAEYFVPLLAALLCLPVSIFCEFQLGNLATGLRLAKMMVSWSTVGITYAATILGFLVAGFAVFATISDKVFFLHLASYRSNGRNISQFKFIFFTFIYVFIAYIVLILASLFFMVAAEENSPFWYLARLCSSRAAPWARIVGVVSL